MAIIIDFFKYYKFRSTLSQDSFYWTSHKMKPNKNNNNNTKK